MLTSTLQSPSDWLSLLFVNQYVSEFAWSGAADHCGVNNLSRLAIKAPIDSPGTALTVSGWPTAAEKSIGVARERT